MDQCGVGTARPPGLITARSPGVHPLFTYMAPRLHQGHPAIDQLPTYEVRNLEDVIEAAGGLVWRMADDQLEVVVIVQSGRSGWSLPKGKLRRGEEALDAALREVREETGLRCAAGDEIAMTTYLDRKGRDKRVRYWAMNVVSGRLRPNEEVDEARWVTVETAATMVADAHDVDVLRSLGGVRASA